MRTASISRCRGWIRRVADLSFSRSLYSESALRAAATAYAGVCTITIEPQNNDFVARFAEGTDTAIVDAFANHALFETIIAPDRLGKSQ